MFELVPGQRPAKEFFAKALADGAVSHAYLLAGPEGLAKTTFARELGVALVASCGGCGACDECERARRGLHPDLHVLEREGELIRISQVEPLLEELALKPFGASRRVWVIPEAEYLTPEAANKLLKSIEEPPEHVHFLLVTDRLERMLETIVSRCQVVEFHPLADGEVLQYLERDCGLAGEAAAAVARLAAGSPEKAARLAADARGPGRRGQYLRQAAQLFGGAGPEAVADARRAFLNVLAAQLAELKEESSARLAERTAELERQFQDRRDRDWHLKRAEALVKREEARRRRLAAVDAYDVLASWVRDLWVVASGAPDVLWNSDHAARLDESAVAAPDLYRRMLEAALATRKDLYLNTDPELALRAAFARFAEVADHA